ncbi:MAG: alpha/beta fold hydrolase [Anaerolineales bacterium]|nr:alpha/beta fold hydrolase [Anaerolineales bacterium]
MKKTGFLFFLCVVLAACSPGPSSAPTPTLTVSPSLTPSPTATPTFTPTVTLTPTPMPIVHPMSIPVMRAGEYPGSEIVVERELERRGNYRRYYAYYLSEGYKIYGLLTIPNGDPPEGGWPALVFNHGYIAPSIYRTTERYVTYVDRLARSGYVVFRIDYRGHDRSEGEARGAYGDPGYTVDVLNAVASLAQHPAVNPEKIGMWGHSMGGFLTLRAMVISPDIKVGVIWAGVVVSYPEMLYNWTRTTPFTPPPGRAPPGGPNGSRPSEPPSRIPNSGRRSRQPVTWPTCRDRCSCTTAPPTMTYRWPFPSAWLNRSGRPGGASNCTPTRGITTTWLSTSPRPWTARSLSLIRF